MKARVGGISVEGFVKNRALRFDNGLELRTQDVLWARREQREKIDAAFQEFVEELRKRGFEIEEPTKP